MKKIYHLSLLFVLSVLIGTTAQSQIVISAVLFNTPGSDSAYEYVQLRATENIDFSVNNYSVVAVNNGSADVYGWAKGAAISYKFNLTTGVVHTGDVFYVGGDSKKLDGKGSADISGLIWIRAINPVTTAGDGFGNTSTSGVFGNAGNNADGVGVFSGIVVDSTSIPIDAIFYGAGIGTAFVTSPPPAKGYKVPTNDHYLQADRFFGQGSNTYFNYTKTAFQDTLLSFTGTYDTIANAWTSPRTTTYVPLTVASPISAINTNITLVGVGVGINQPNDLETISLYPNPSNGRVTLTNPNEYKIHVKILNLLGSNVYSTKTQSQTTSLDLTDFDKGVYFVRINDGSGKRITKKLVIR